MVKTCSRRSLLHGSIKGATGILLGSALGSLWLSSCKKNNARSHQDAINLGEKQVPMCSDHQSLNEHEKSLRATLKYVDSSPLVDRTCDNCKLYFRADNKALCGLCKVIPGQVHPQGYCIAWLHRMQ